MIDTIRGELERLTRRSSRDNDGVSAVEYDEYRRIHRPLVYGVSPVYECKECGKRGPNPHTIRHIEYCDKRREIVDNFL